MGHSSFQLYVVIIGTFLHILWNYLFIIKLKLGVIGIGYTATLSDLFLLLGNIFMTYLCSDLKDALKISICNKEVYKNICEYLKIGIPGIFIMMSAWGSYEILNILSGFLGVHNQACQVILCNIQILLFNIPFGIQISACGIIGRLIGASQLQQAQRSERVIFIFSFFLNILVFLLFSHYKESFVNIFTQDEALVELTNS